jgi:hypothetical protein
MVEQMEVDRPEMQPSNLGCSMEPNWGTVSVYMEMSQQNLLSYTKRMF